MRRNAIVCLLVLIMIVLSSSMTAMELVETREYWWGGAISWYQNPDPEAIAGARPIYVVVDPDYGPGDEPWSRSDIEWMKAGGTRVIAYLNIGFAEEWRSYWNESWSKESHPEWLTWVEYPGWPGEYFVKFWDYSAWEPGGWVDILKKELKKIIDIGFSGVRLDNIDACVMWENPSDYNLSLPRVENACEWMIYLVGNLSSYAKSLDPDFVIVANMGGALSLLGNESFLEAIDVVEREDVWYSDDEPVDPMENSEALYWLEYARDHGKEVMVTDYAWTPWKIMDALGKARGEGFYIYVASTRDLDTLADYVPSYLGLSVVNTTRGLYAVWSYHGVVDSELRSFDIYMTLLDDNKDIEPVRISGIGDDKWPSAIYLRDLDVIAVTWEKCGSSNCTIELALVNPDNPREVYGNTSIVYPGYSLRKPAIAFFNNKIYIIYLNISSSTKLYYTVIDLNTLEQEETQILSSNVLEATCIHVAESSSSIMVTWVDEDYSLHATLIDDSGVIVDKVVSANVDPRRHCVAYVPQKDVYVVAYSISNETKIIIVDTHGSILSRISIDEPLAWFPVITVVEDNKIAYTSVNKVVVVNIDDGSVVEEKELEKLPVTGMSLIHLDQELQVITPDYGSNNTVKILSIKLVSRETTTTTTTTISTTTSTTTTITTITHTTTTTTTTTETVETTQSSPTETSQQPTSLVQYSHVLILIVMLVIIVVLILIKYKK
ncbi:endo alpha-1,4 polygalactosaminidase [Desulfurococcaceae archaeon MEX13E-LK6-19]|nr:endo alpha-1,4 polygalactosaminidase [Desulfurococcaceae archaeon MEX13E-LK6-19]